METLRVRGGSAWSQRKGRRERLPGCPFQALGARLDAVRALPAPGLPPFCGGAVGHLGYEMSRYLEPSLALPPSDEDEACLMVFPDVAAFDHLRQKLLLIANVIPGSGSVSRACCRASDALDRMQARLEAPLRAAPLPALKERVPARVRLGGAAFQRGVRELKRDIRAGEIFQAVLSERFEFPLPGDPFGAYRGVRGLNPSPYMFYIAGGGEAVLGASPEMLVRVHGSEVETRPIAGTRPRGRDTVEEARLRRNLLGSVKEKAEHLMLVDLGRNDLGRVCRPGSVRVESFMQVERYSHVMHLVSSVRGRLRRGLSAWDAFGACFPAGTVTGAPKIRAMQLVAELEKAPRGFYAGAVVYRDFQGNLDSAIAIRSLAVRRRGGRALASVQAGAGIVADSRPEAELQEVRSKARAMLEAAGARA